MFVLNMAADGAVSVVLVCKPKELNPTWDFFGLKANTEARVVKSTADCPVCKLCGKAVLYRLRVAFYSFYLF